MFLSSLSSSWRVPNVPVQDNFSRVDNLGRSVPTDMSLVGFPMINAGYRWSNVLAMRYSHDYLKPTPSNFFPLSREEELKV